MQFSEKKIISQADEKNTLKSEKHALKKCHKISKNMQKMSDWEVRKSALKLNSILHFIMMILIVII